MKRRNYGVDSLLFVISGLVLSSQSLTISTAFPIHHRDIRRPTARPLALLEVRRPMDSDVLSDPTGPMSPTTPVEILDQNDFYLVVNKPPSVVCHHSPWTGSRRSGVEIPMLQRVREQVQRRVNLVHRLDRGASGCLLLTYADPPEATTILSEALHQNSTKTYLALVRGEGIVNGTDLKQLGWFRVERPIRDEHGRTREAATWFRFVAGQDNGAGTLDRARASLVLARPETGRWHQIRKHLNGLSHPILGDSTHGSSQVNREWKERRGLPSARTCLHLSRLEIGRTSVCPEGIDVTSPLASDLMDLLRNQLPDVLASAEPFLKEEGIVL